MNDKKSIWNWDQEQVCWLAYVEMFILDLTRVLMNKVHYEYIRNNYGNKARLLLTDTDSLTCEIETKNVYNNISGDKELFDFNKYKKSKMLWWNK